MSWNYRIIRRTYDEYGVETYTIHSVHYNEKGDPTLVSTEPSSVMGQTLEELKDDFDMQRVAFGKPILDYEDFG